DQGRYRRLRAAPRLRQRLDGVVAARRAFVLERRRQDVDGVVLAAAVAAQGGGGRGADSRGRVPPGVAQGPTAGRGQRFHAAEGTGGAGADRGVLAGQRLGQVGGRRGADAGQGFLGGVARGGVLEALDERRHGGTGSGPQGGQRLDRPGA